MTFAIPTLKDLAERARSAFRSYLPGTDAWLWPNNINPTAKVIGGMTHEVFGFADYIAKQKFALTADSFHLDLHGEEYGLSRKAATAASGIVRIVAPTGVTVALNSVLRRSDGIEYRATAATVGSGIVDVPVKAITNGKSTVAIKGTALVAVSGFTGTPTSIEVGPNGITGGTDVEDDNRFRERILFRKRNPIHGGDPADYVIWTSEVVGVTRVFVEPRHLGPGFVRVFPLMDDTYANGIPQPGDIQTIQGYLKLKAPAGAVVMAQAPVPVPVNVTTQAMLPDSADVDAAVLSELLDAFFQLGRVAGNAEPHNSLPFLATPFSFSRSWVWQAIANATGEERHILLAPSADVVLTAGQIPVLGNVLHT